MFIIVVNKKRPPVLYRWPLSAFSIYAKVLKLVHKTKVFLCSVNVFSNLVPVNTKNHLDLNKY